MSDFNEYSFLCHHGIKGMKWGIRRYQNKDGSLTAAGREHYGYSETNSLRNAKSIARSISAQVKKDAKPRPVYSPRDPELQLKGETIVKNPEKIKTKNFSELESKIDSINGDARFYTHVNWAGSTGGHEFLLIKSGDKKYIMDPQVGKMEPLSNNSVYFKDINYNNSYIARLDNKEFNTKLFNEVNDRKKTLPWNTKLDAPYMYKEGMITKEEYEMVLKDPNIMYEGK